MPRACVIGLGCLLLLGLLVAAPRAQAKPSPAVERANALKAEYMTRWSVGLVAGAIGIPTLVGLVVALPIWIRSGDSTLGSAIGAGAVVMASLVLFANQYVGFERLMAACKEAGMLCLPFKYSSARYLTIGMLSFVDIAIVFMVGLKRDERRRRGELHAAV